MVIHSAWVYPVVSAWIFGGGWLYKNGFRDYAGAGCVYLNGGSCGLVGAYLLGPRFDTKQVSQDRELTIQKEELASP